MQQTGSLTVHLQDEDGDPMAGRKVHCEYPGMFGSYAEEYTDDEGSAHFEKVPVCVVSVRANGAETEVGVGAGKHEDVTLTL